MNKLVELEEKVQKMMDGERKRRDIALKFVQSLQELLLPVAPDLWGTGGAGEENAKFVEFGRIYFRYKDIYKSGNSEDVGFYIVNQKYPEFAIWGTRIEDLRGNQFWKNIKCIIDWIPELTKSIKFKEETREKILDLLS